MIEVKSLDELADTAKWTKIFENYDSFFSCLGARSNAPKVLSHLNNINLAYFVKKSIS